MRSYRWLLPIALAVLACNVDAGDIGREELTLEPAPRPVDLVWVTGEGVGPDPAVVDGLTRMAAEDAIDLRVVVLGGDHPFDGPEFTSALRDEAAVQVVLAGPLGAEEDAAALDEQIAWAVGGPYVLHVIEPAEGSSWGEVASFTGGITGIAEHQDVTAHLVEGVVESAPLPCTFEMPAEVLDAATRPEQWDVQHASGTLREPVRDVGDASGCAGDGGWYAGEAGSVHLCPSSCALGAAGPEGRLVVAPVPSP